MKKNNILLLLFILFFTSSCITRSITQKGNIFDNSDLMDIKVGLTNKDNVLKILGYPLSKSYFNDNIWIYYSYQMKEVLFFKPYIDEQKVLVLKFDDETNIVNDMFLYNIESNNYEILNTTDTSNQDKQNIIQDILKNIGQITM